jgi:glucose-6-phosphate 1-dehydrogenase
MCAQNSPQTAAIVDAPPRRQAKPPGPCAMVIFGAGGDLTKRLLVPALYNLSTTGLIPERFALVGVDLAQDTPEGWAGSLRKMLDSFVGNPSSESRIDHVDETAWKRLTDAMSYLQGDLNDATLYQKLAGHLNDLGRERQTQGNVLFYLAVADRFFGPVIQQLGRAGLAHDAAHPGEAEHWRRVVIEKPFGHSLGSARTLNQAVRRVLEEEQIYRIDHFLGKETVQNIMAFRFANGIFEPIWNRDRIDHVQITVAETVGVEGRGRFYEQTGALRDMVPNHVFQLLAMVAMEPPASFDASAVRSRKDDLFQAMRSVRPEDAVRGQYGPGRFGEQALPGYREEPNVDRASATETFVALRLAIDNWRWAGVPFYLRTGKRMSGRYPVQVRPAGAVRGYQRRRVAAQLAGPAHSAGRGHFLAVRSKATRTGGGPCGCTDGFQICRLVRARAECWVRDFDLRRNDWRPDAVQPRRHGGGDLARGAAGAGCLGVRPGAAVSELRCRP